MPRKAREKHSEAIFHVMCRSVSEILLFRDDEDKDYYLELLKRYTQKYQCSIYAYCLMDNHLHLHLDPHGFDISKFMHSTNTAYVRYYNKKYKRHGHVFADRFESRVLDTDAYNLTVSAYIHNNPKDIEGYSNKEEKYKYSSYGIYLGVREDILKLVDKSFIMGLFNILDEEKFTQKYLAFVSCQRDLGSFKEIKKILSSAVEYEYLSGRKIIMRDLSPAKVISFISSKIMISGKAMLAVKGKRKLYEFRAFTAYVLQVLCGLNYKEICSNIYNLTNSGCARLCSKGYKLIEDGVTVYKDLFDELIALKA